MPAAPSSSAELRCGLSLGGRHLVLPLGLAGDGVGRAERSLGARANPIHQRRVHLFLGQLPRLLCARFGETDDGLDHRLDRFVTEGHGAQHLVFGELGRLRFDHEHTLLGAGHDQIEVGRRALLVGRVQHIGAVGEADATPPDRPHEGQAGDGERGRRADHGDDVGIVDQVVREHRADDLGLVAKRLDEEGPERPVDKPGDQGLLLARAPFALEEAARNLAGGECLLLIVDCQREEVLPFPCAPLADDGAKHRRFTVAREDGAIRLAGDAPGFEDELAPTPHDLTTCDIEHVVSFVPVASRPFGSPLYRRNAGGGGPCRASRRALLTRAPHPADHATANAICANPTAESRWRSAPDRCASDSPAGGACG